MKATLALACSGACVTSMVAAAGLNVTELEARVLAGEVTPETAIMEYCKAEPLDMTQDAFCSCPDEALRLLKERLNLYRMDGS